MEEKLFNDDELYKVPDVAKKLKMSTDMVYMYIRNKKLKAVRIGSRKGYRILGKHLNEFFGYKEPEEEEIQVSDK